MKTSPSARAECVQYHFLTALLRLFGCHLSTSHDNDPVLTETEAALALHRVILRRELLDSELCVRSRCNPDIYIFFPLS